MDLYGPEEEPADTVFAEGQRAIERYDEAVMRAAREDVREGWQGRIEG